ncbi:MAG: J domain-containing protein [Acidimicrobiales bacterium]|nr:J domain-containing protein [Acidimicrobiales bacterium]
MTKVSVDDALRLLDVERDTPWEEIRSLYRQRIRSAHPDLGNDENENDLVISLNAAYATLAEATKNGKEPLPTKIPTVEAEPETNSVVRFSDQLDPFDLLLDVSDDVGDVIYASEDDGLIQVLIDGGKRSESILLIQINESKQPVQVLFTLDLQSGDHPINLADLVKRFGEFEPV